MTMWLLFLLALSVLSLSVLARDLARDGLGVRPAPRSHDHEAVTWR